MESADSKPTRNVSTPKPRRTSVRQGSTAESSRKRQSAAVTIRDVAERSGFSSATVSIVLNNAPLARYIPDTTKGRI
ncbi:MAG: LacI family DNA-binding transcriptional regulator, partial [Terriglobales bacterium]